LRPLDSSRAPVEFHHEIIGREIQDGLPAPVHHTGVDEHTRHSYALFDSLLRGRTSRQCRDGAHRPQAMQKDPASHEDLS
jgi:hypothetical protein